MLNEIQTTTLRNRDAMKGKKDYDDKAHKRDYGAVERDDKPSTEDVGRVAEKAEIGPDIHRGRIAHSFAPSPAGAHGFGHSGGQRKGALRLSGDKKAHRIGAR